MANTDMHVDVAIVGAGTAGLNAMKEVQLAGKSFVLIDHGPLGTTCARVGCMPSKAVLHAGAVWQGYTLPAIGRGDAIKHEISANDLWSKAQQTRTMLYSGLADRTRASAGDRLLMGHAQFVSPDAIEVDGQRIHAQAFVIATGSTPVLPAFLDRVKDRVLTTDSVFDLDVLPETIGIIGLGAIGLEIGLALARLGVRVIAADKQQQAGGISDPEISKRVLQRFGREKGLTMWLGTDISVQPSEDGVSVSISNGVTTEKVEWLLAAMGRKPNLAGLRLDLAGIDLNESGRPAVDPHTTRSGQSAIYFAGDVAGIRPLLHEAADEGLIAGWNTARHGQTTAFHRRVPFAIVFSDPDIAAIGVPFHELDPDHTIIGAAFGQTNGRSRVMGAEENLVRIYADANSGELRGAAVFASHGEHIAYLLAWAIQRGETAASLLEMPFYHPTVEEMVQAALFDIVKQQGKPHICPVGLRPMKHRA
ncbi:dihydrolipoyl dehydrogenase [Oxalobacteraceae bacterium R-40]|uniref:Dihydrolipoyl dehydrogenase n=1 Tax=Keguizhuia sedimenti TaxID=3064264 RepID=A0ABU1BWI0_9BURK|nr:dihydrolipoyl dehydrogenase [Oxalobacteraceae bacterium R-40]